MSHIPILKGFRELAPHYRVLICDIWGVLHNGHRPFDGVIDCLSEFRASGGYVLLLSNAPRPNPAIREQLTGLGVPENQYDTIVTSGDLTRELLVTCAATGTYPIHHVGPERGLTLFDGLDVPRVSMEEARAIVCTGPFDDTTEGPDDYRQYWAPALSRRIPLYCANPDLQVQRGDQLIYCAGALAQDYERQGGNVTYLGKPHLPVYEFVARHLAGLLATVPPKDKWLAIGDGLKTDILGATRYGIDALLITGGIHESLLANSKGEPDSGKIASQLGSENLKAKAAMRRLVW